VTSTPARLSSRGPVRTSVSAVLAALVLWAAAAPLPAQQTQPTRVHVVRPGETLWDIARAYLADPFLWPEIFRLNADVVRDPALIYPNDRLVIPGGERRVDAPVFMGPAEAGPAPAPPPAGPPVLAVLPGDFHRVSYVATAGEVTAVGRYVEPVFQTVIDQRMPAQVNLYDRLFVRVQPGRVSLGDRLLFLREGRELRPRGRVYRPTGTGTVAAIDGDVATVVVVGMYDRLQPGDLVTHFDRFPLSEGVFPSAVEADLATRILGFQETNPLQRTESILYLDAGRTAGVAVGDEFEVYVPVERRPWGARPEVRVARLQVVRVTERTASVRVTELEQPRIAVGLPARRVARMP
jgi:LysM repeat protein